MVARLQALSLLFVVSFALVACHRVGSHDDAGAPDADADTDSDTDVDSDTDADTETETECPPVIDELCNDVPEPMVLIGLDAAPGPGPARFIDMTTTTDYPEPGIGVLTESDYGEGDWVPSVLMFDYDEQAAAGEPVVVVASGLGEFDNDERAHRLADQIGAALTASNDFLVLLRSNADDRHVLGGVSTAYMAEPTLQRLLDDPFPAEADVNGICGLSSSVLFAYGDGVWQVSEDHTAWNAVEQVDPFPAINDMGATDGPGGTRLTAVGDDGRVLVYWSSSWSNGGAGTDKDLYAVAACHYLETPASPAAGGEDGVVVIDPVDDSSNCELAGSDVLSMVWLYGGGYRYVVGTADGLVLRIESANVGCIAAELGEPVLALEAASIYGLKGGCQYVLALTEHALHTWVDSCNFEN